MVHFPSQPEKHVYPQTWWLDTLGVSEIAKHCAIWDRISSEHFGHELLQSEFVSSRNLRPAPLCGHNQLLACFDPLTGNRLEACCILISGSRCASHFLKNAG